MTLTRDVLEALVVALPSCDECDRPATKAFGRGAGRWCDAHGLRPRTGVAPDYPRAEALRAALLLLSAPGEPGDSLLRRTLLWYADEKHWMPAGNALVDEDVGARAREALSILRAASHGSGPPSGRPSRRPKGEA